MQEEKIGQKKYVTENVVLLYSAGSNLQLVIYSLITIV